MKLEEIRLINQKGISILNQKYYGDDGSTYIGVIGGRLQKLNIDTTKISELINNDQLINSVSDTSTVLLNIDDLKNLSAEFSSLNISQFTNDKPYAVGTASALTSSPDTNITLTVPVNTALLSPLNITLGWTGQLSPSRGGTGISNTGTITVGGNTAFSGAFTFTGTLTGNTSVTFPTSGTLSTSTGTVTTVSVSTNQGVSGSVANPGTTPAITLSLGALTGVTSFNGLVITANTGVITSGTWNGTVITGQYGGTGVANTGKTITLAGNLSTTGAFNTTFAQQGSYTLTLPPGTSVLSASSSALTSGRIPYVTTSGFLTDTSNLLWDNSNLDLTEGDVGGASKKLKLYIGNSTDTMYLGDNTSTTEKGIFYYGSTSSGATFTETGVIIDNFNTTYSIGNLNNDFILVQTGVVTALSSSTNVTIATPTLFFVLDESTLKFTFQAGGTVNMTLANYANDAAAGIAGLTTGDLYQTVTAGEGVVKIKQ